MEDELEVMEIAKRAKGRNLTPSEANKIIHYCIETRVRGHGSCVFCVLRKHFSKGGNCPVIISTQIEGGEPVEQKSNE